MVKGPEGEGGGGLIHPPPPPVSPGYVVIRHMRVSNWPIRRTGSI